MQCTTTKTTKKNARSLSRKSDRKTSRKPPAYRQRKGYDQAIVTLADSRTGILLEVIVRLFNTPVTRPLLLRCRWPNATKKPGPNTPSV